MNEPPTRTWTSAKPTKAGWYWYKTSETSPDYWVEELMAYPDGDGLYRMHQGMRFDLYNGGFWYGPLDSPPQE